MGRGRDGGDERDNTRRSDDFEVWVGPHLVVMANLAARLAGPSDRDDVVQESLSRAWRRWETYKPERGSPRAWLLAIVADQSRRLTRRRRSPNVSATLRPDIRRPDERDLDLEAAIDRLPKRQRLAVELFYLVDLSVADTAAILGCSEGTVKSALSDARDRLRNLLKEAGQ